MKLFLWVIVFVPMVVGFLYICSFGSACTTEAPLANSIHIDTEQKTDLRFCFVLQTEQSSGVASTDSINGIQLINRKTKDPFKAFIYAIVPGAIIHGAGHMYAGDMTTGFVLFGSELAGVGLMFLGGLGGFENGESTNGGDYAIFAGSVLFVGSWLYDIVESSMAVKKRNRKLLEQKSTGLEFRMNDAEPKLVIVWRF